MTITIEGERIRSTGLRVDAVSDFFRHRGPIWADGEEVYDFFRRFGVLGNGLVGWFDQTAMRAVDLQSWRNLVAGREVLDQPVAGKQPSIILPFGNKATRVFDGIADYMAQEVFDDETGAIFWPTNAGMIAVDGSAAIRFGTVSLASFAGVAGSSTPYLIDIADSAGKHCFGYLAESDAAEALGGELIVNGDFSVALGAEWDLVISGGGSIAIVAGELVFTQVTQTQLFATQDIPTTIGKLYKLTIEMISEGASGYNAVYIGTSIRGSQTYSSGYTINPGVKTIYFIAEATLSYISIQDIGSDGEITIWDNVSVKEVTSLGTNGCHIVSTKNGATQNWVYKDASFDYNDSSGYTFEIRKTDFQITGDFTVLAWAKSPDVNDKIFSKCDYGAVNQRSIMLYLQGNGYLQLYLTSDGSAGTAKNVTGSTDLSDDAWHHFGGVFSASTYLRVFEDGVQSNENTTGIMASIHDTYIETVIGSIYLAGSLTDHWNGEIASVMVFSRALSAAEAEVIARVFAISGRN